MGPPGTGIDNNSLINAAKPVTLWCADGSTFGSVSGMTASGMLCSSPATLGGNSAFALGSGNSPAILRLGNWNIYQNMTTGNLHFTNSDSPIDRFIIPSVNYTFTAKNSSILNTKHVTALVNMMYPLGIFNFNLLYRSSRDGLNPIIFHQLCDNYTAGRPPGSLFFVLKNNNGSIATIYITGQPYLNKGGVFISNNTWRNEAGAPGTLWINPLDDGKGNISSSTWTNTGASANLYSDTAGSFPTFIYTNNGGFLQLNWTGSSVNAVLTTVGSSQFINTGLYNILTPPNVNVTSTPPQVSLLGIPLSSGGTSIITDIEVYGVNNFIV